MDIPTVYRDLSAPIDVVPVTDTVKKAYGYRNRERVKTDILFHISGPNLYPTL